MIPVMITPLSPICCPHDRNVKNVNKMNQRELELGLAGTSTSWHAQYKDSAWIFVGGLPYDLSEGDVLCIFSQ